MLSPITQQPMPSYPSPTFPSHYAGYIRPPQPGFYSQTIHQSQPSFPAPHQASLKGIPCMERPSVSIVCPPGLEYLTQINQLFVHQKIEYLEALTGFETANKYVITNSLGQQVYYAVE
ncbi:phospholipid scramblase 1-like protein, partial [Dinothrombium tinctorium]